MPDQTFGQMPGQMVDQMLDRMIRHQQTRVLAHARRIDPRLTEDDILQPDDYPQLRGDPQWNYEDGVLAGMMAAQMAIRAELRRQEPQEDAPPAELLDPDRQRT